MEVLHGETLIKEFLHSLYECRYDAFFRALGECLYTQVGFYDCASETWWDLCMLSD